MTLLTRPSYFAGVIILSHTLRAHSSAYPLVVLTTPSLPADCLSALEAECRQSSSKLIIHPVEQLLPNTEVSIVATRFEDTWTKLRAFELYNLGLDTLVFLDADMAIFKNCDELMETKLPGSDWVGANHACVCNLDRDPWAPEDWRKGNCAYTPLTHPSVMLSPTPVTPDARPTYHLLNSGMFVYHPSKQLWDRMLHFFNTTPLLKEFVFPDQDFIIHFFRNKWMSLGWQYNALKTMRYWHPGMWRDDEVRVLHYIVDKPWERRVASDGNAGHLGRDGFTHSWWWDCWDLWVREKESLGDEGREVLATVEKYVAGKLDGEGDKKQVEENKKYDAGLNYKPLPERPGRPEDVLIDGKPVGTSKQDGATKDAEDAKPEREYVFNVVDGRYMFPGRTDMTEST